MADQKVYYTDTNGASKSMTFTDFQGYWNWTCDGVAYASLAGLGITKQTMLW